MDTLDPGSGRPTVIVVNGDPAVRKALRFALELEGFNVLACATGDEALRLEFRSANACLVVDEHLRDQSGASLLGEFRRRSVKLPAVLLASRWRESVATEARDVDAMVLEKPLLGNELVAWIRGVLPGTAA